MLVSVLFQEEDNATEAFMMVCGLDNSCVRMCVCAHVVLSIVFISGVANCA